MVPCLRAGEAEVPGLTDESKPRLRGPKRASKIRKLFNLTKEDDVRKYVNVFRKVRAGATAGLPPVSPAQLPQVAACLDKLYRSGPSLIAAIPHKESDRTCARALVVVLTGSCRGGREQALTSVTLPSLPEAGCSGIRLSIRLSSALTIVSWCSA